MNHQKLPDYPEHPEPTEAISNSEFERETRPRTSPGSMVWMGIGLLVCLYVLDRTVNYLQEWNKGNNVVKSVPAKQGN
ncbi:MAG: hypothetical protein JNJ77_04775 [Planctomycetia bacterium]|nr:hypothetical protein [Planctomycetia bacterium]